MVLSPAIVGLGLTAAAHAADTGRSVPRADDSATQPVSAPAADDTLDLWDLPPPPPPIASTDDLLRTHASLELVDVDVVLPELAARRTAAVHTPELAIHSDLEDFRATLRGDFTPFEVCTLAPDQHPHGRLVLSGRLHEGHIVDLTVARDTTGERRVADCLTDLLWSWELPPELTQDVTWTLDLAR